MGLRTTGALHGVGTHQGSRAQSPPGRGGSRTAATASVGGEGAAGVRTPGPGPPCLGWRGQGSGLCPHPSGSSPFCPWGLGAPLSCKPRKWVGQERGTWGQGPPPLVVRAPAPSENPLLLAQGQALGTQQPEWTQAHPGVNRASWGDSRCPGSGKAHPGGADPKGKGGASFCRPRPWVHTCPLIPRRATSSPGSPTGGPVTWPQPARAMGAATSVGTQHDLRGGLLPLPRTGHTLGQHRTRLPSLSTGVWRRFAR